MKHSKSSRLNSDQVVKVIHNCSNIRDMAMMAVMYQCGLRRSEVSSMRRAHYNMLDGILVVSRSKRGVSHSFKLWDQVRFLLDYYLTNRTDDDEAMFRSRKKGPITMQGVYYAYKNAAKAAGLPKELCHPHCLRHTIGSHLTLVGLDIETVQQYLGHRHPEGTVWYTKGSISPGDRNMESAYYNAAVAYFGPPENNPKKKPLISLADPKPIDPDRGIPFGLL